MLQGPAIPAHRMSVRFHTTYLSAVDTHLCDLLFCLRETTLQNLFGIRKHHDAGPDIGKRSAFSIKTAYRTNSCDRCRKTYVIDGSQELKQRRTHLGGGAPHWVGATWPLPVSVPIPAAWPSETMQTAGQIGARRREKAERKERDWCEKQRERRLSFTGGLRMYKEDSRQPKTERKRHAVHHAEHNNQSNSKTGTISKTSTNSKTRTNKKPLVTSVVSKREESDRKEKKHKESMRPTTPSDPTCRVGS